jgi:GNAT superfamily N-acetyltransferase
MLFEAFFWRPEQPRPSYNDFASHSEFVKLLREWGREGDRALIAEVDGELAGAAWFRLWTDGEHSYGYLDAQTPELGMGVARKQRSKGVGRALLQALIKQAGKDGYAALSLSVEPENFSRNLYESEGFVKVDEEGDAWTMLKKLS